jgi:hypothetical protein
MKKMYILTIDKGVPLPGDTQPSLIAQCREKVPSMEIGDSFFLAHVTKDNILKALDYCEEHFDAFLLPAETDLDEVYQLPGVRVWRILSHEPVPVPEKTKVEKPKKVKDEDDEIRRPNQPTFWQSKKKVKGVYELTVCGPGQRPEPHEKWSQISEPEFDRLTADAEAAANTPLEDRPDGNTYAEETYWYHAESESYMALPPGDHSELFNTADGALLAPIDRDEYAKHMAEQEQEFGGNFWQDKKGVVVTEYLPGKWPPAAKGYNRATYSEYKAYQNKQIPETFWRKSCGTCVKVPRAKLEVAMKTPGAVQITVNEYNDWLAEQDNEL